MKKIHLLLLKSFVRPFLVTFLIVMFMLLMLFLWKYIDDMIGKGFQWYVILELMAYASATNVQMALPLSVLLSSIMTYGSLGENYELVAIKSAGISLTRAMFPMFVLVCGLSIGAFFFSDYMLPVASLKYYRLLYDVREQKSANFLPEGVFSNSFANNTIRVQKKDPDGQTLYGLTIYSKDPLKNTSFMVMAKQGKMYRTFDNKYLIIELKDGIRYEENAGSGTGVYIPRRVFIRQRFKSTTQKLDLSGIASMKATDESSFKNGLQMMNMRMLGDTIRVLNKNLDSIRMANFQLMSPFIKYFAVPARPDSAKIKAVAYKPNWYKALPITDKQQALITARQEVNSVKEQYKIRMGAFDNIKLSEHGAQVEYYKKFTLSAACLALFLIGAPLGAIIRKGGLGLPVVVSVVFFLIYYIISTIGEKAVKAGDASPFIGMWISIIILTPIGIFLSYKAANDSVIFDADSYKKYFANLLAKIKPLFSKKAAA
ncbi:LptF/LptG family permease [Mucilaginibacter calamicampi]|uniref:LptF/LptG family permease n=1 Tax=Mucilaginibacter calamicampi TaxID=1302352 RepID=A0ABW2YZI0_9SPHI